MHITKITELLVNIDIYLFIFTISQFNYDLTDRILTNIMIVFSIDDVS